MIRLLFSHKICYITWVDFVRRSKIKHNYLNNKDILKEIHKSKNTYCSYAQVEYSDYDVIVHGLDQINHVTIQQARENRADRLAKLSLETANAQGGKHKLDEFVVDSVTIPDTELVFRVMTWDHIPVDAAATKKTLDIVDDEAIYTEYDDDINNDIDEAVKEATTTVKYVKCNFPPFQHFKLDHTGNIYCVGKSHWKGNLDTGAWSRDHGTMTRTLATMFIKLCERYATRSNWRGYTYNDEMRSQALLQLSQIGLQFDESKSQNPFAYYTAAITNSFTRVLNIEKRNQNLRDDILEMNGFSPSYTRQGMFSGHQSDDHD